MPAYDLRQSPSKSQRRVDWEAAARAVVGAAGGVKKPRQPRKPRGGAKLRRQQPTQSSLPFPPGEREEGGDGDDDRSSSIPSESRVDPDATQSPSPVRSDIVHR
jgi:hypothetical protein